MAAMGSIFVSACGASNVTRGGGGALVLSWHAAAVRSAAATTSRAKEFVRCTTRIAQLLRKTLGCSRCHSFRGETGERIQTGQVEWLRDLPRPKFDAHYLCAGNSSASSAGAANVRWSGRLVANEESSD